MELNMETAVRNPEQYGFTWGTVGVSTDNKSTDLGDIPCPILTDSAKFVEAFGESSLLGIANGSSSIRVRAQTIGRNARLKNHAVTADELKPKMVKMLAGIKNDTTVQVREVYVLPNGEKTTDKAEALEAWQNA